MYGHPITHARLPIPGAFVVANIPTAQGKHDAPVATYLLGRHNSLGRKAKAEKRKASTRLLSSESYPCSCRSVAAAAAAACRCCCRQVAAGGERGLAAPQSPSAMTDALPTRCGGSALAMASRASLQTCTRGCGGVAFGSEVGERQRRAALRTPARRGLVWNRAPAPPTCSRAKQPASSYKRMLSAPSDAA